MENEIITIGKSVIDLQIKALKKLKNTLDSNFQKAIKKIIKCNENSVSKVGKLAAILARSEGLEAHAKSAEMRYKILKN